MARINISIPDDFLPEVDSYASQFAMTRSGLITTALREYIDSRKKLPIITGMFNSFAQLLDDKANGRISDQEFKDQLTLFAGTPDGKDP